MTGNQTRARRTFCLAATVDLRWTRGHETRSPARDAASPARCARPGRIVVYDVPQDGTSPDAMHLARISRALTDHRLAQIPRCPAGITPCCMCGTADHLVSRRRSP